LAPWDGGTLACDSVLYGFIISTLVALGSYQGPGFSRAVGVFRFWFSDHSDGARSRRFWTHLLPAGGDRLQVPQTTVLRVLALHRRRSVHNWRIFPSASLIAGVQAFERPTPEPLPACGNPQGTNQAS